MLKFGLTLFALLLPALVAGAAQADEAAQRPLSGITHQQGPSPTPPAGQLQQPRLALYQGLDFYGDDRYANRQEDAGRTREASVEDCSKACISDNFCAGFTFNANPNIKRGPNCYLKYHVTHPQAYADAVSGVLVAADEEVESFDVDTIDPSSVLAKTGLTGPNIDTSLSDGIITAGPCRAACLGDDECRAFTFDANLKQCFLKGEAGQQVANPNLSSGIKRVVRFSPVSVTALPR
ncbi:MAG TPA: PAN domain-containing protein [Devosiaceae bacterium]